MNEYIYTHTSMYSSSGNSSCGITSIYDNDYKQFKCIAM